MLGGKLIRHHNYREYWVCGSCGRPRKEKNRYVKCYKCRSTTPPRLRITTREGRWDPILHRKPLGGDSHRADSRTSRVMRKAAAVARKALAENYHDRPVRDVLLGSWPEETPKRSRKWFCQVFLGGERYIGVLDREICLFNNIEEVLKNMSGNKKMMQIRIPTDLHKWLKLYAAKNDTTMTEIVISYISRLKKSDEKKVEVTQI